MKNTSIKIIFGFLTVLAILTTLYGFVGTVAEFSGQPFAIFSEKVWFPLYWSAECVPIDGLDMRTTPITTHTDNPTFYHCASGYTGTWIPTTGGLTCKYHVYNAQTLEAYKCTGFTESQSDLSTSKCSRIGSAFSTGRTDFEISSGDTLWINTGNVFSTATLEAQYPAYGLKQKSALGEIQSTTSTCKVNDISISNPHYLNLQNRIVVEPNIPINAITTTIEAISSQAITISGINNGKPIYVSKPHYYNPIATTEDGLKYVDTKKEINDNRIECVPGTPTCNSEAKIVDIKSMTCETVGVGITLGQTTGYLGLSNDPTRQCKYVCDSSGKLSLTNDCIILDTRCATPTPYLDPNTGKCSAVNVIPTVPNQENKDYMPLAILVLGGLGLYALNTQKKNLPKSKK